MTVDIRVGISGEGWTVNKIQFTYFANTSAKNCLAYGPGLLPQVHRSRLVDFCDRVCIRSSVAEQQDLQELAQPCSWTLQTLHAMFGDMGCTAKIDCDNHFCRVRSLV